MISKNKLPNELKRLTPVILKLLDNSAVRNINEISIKLYNTDTHNNLRKAKQLLKILESKKIVRSEKGSYQRKLWMLFDTIRIGKPNCINADVITALFTDHSPVLSNVDIAHALFSNIDSDIRYRTSAITNQMAKRGELIRKKSNGIVYSALPTYSMQRIDRHIRKAEKSASNRDPAAQKSNKLMQQALLFIQIMSQNNPHAIG